MILIFEILAGIQMFSSAFGRGRNSRLVGTQIRWRGWSWLKKLGRSWKSTVSRLKVTLAVFPLDIVWDVDTWIEEALVLQETVLKMEKPQSGTVEALKLWLDGRSEGPGGRHAPSFSGLMAHRLDDEENLVAMHPAFEKDWLARLVEVPYLRLLCLVNSTIYKNKLATYFYLGFTRRWIDSIILDEKDQSSGCDH